MEYSDHSFVARIEQDRERYLHFTRLALEKEAAAADLMVDEDVEPTRGVLHRSAATLAWRCGEYDRAKKLIYRALAGNPRGDIERELNDLLTKVRLALGHETDAKNGRGRAGCQPTDETVSKTGVLKIARAIDGGECELVTEESGKWTIEIPNDMMNEILGFYFNKRVEVEGKRMKKTRLLQRIRLDSIAQVRAL